MKKLLSCIAILFIVTSCSKSFKDSLGLKKPAPDEFTVISYPPLTTPPDFKLNEPKFDENAIIVEESSRQKAKLTKEELQFLNTLKHVDSKSSVAQTIDNEQRMGKEEVENGGAVKKALYKLNGNEDPVINPETEKKRIKKNLENNKPINEGKVENQESKSTIQRIFGN